MIRNETGFDEGLVSVVTPVYNGEKYLNRLMNSVRNQSWEKVEMIVVDDGSEDNTLKTAEEFRDNFEEKGYLLKVISAEHKNAAAAVARGLKEVTGEYIIWPDGDDELLPDSIEKRALFLKNNKQYNCVRSLSSYVDYETGLSVKREEQVGDLSTHKLFWDILFGKTFVCCGCYMVRSTEFFRIYKEYELPVYNVGQNFQMLLPFMYFNECPTIEEDLYVVNRREDSHSARRLNETEERNKYKEYESLIDDIVNIIGISDGGELRKIELWKQQRRMHIAVKYADSKLRIRTAICLYKMGDITFVKVCKNIVKSFFVCHR